MITLALTEQQAQNLAEVLDIATKAGGMQVAKVTLPIMDLLMKSVEESKEQQPKEQL